MSNFLNNKIRSGLIWSVVRVWGNRLSGILIFFILARILNPHDFGVYSAIWSLLLLLEVLSEQGMSDAIIQRESVSNTLLNTIFYINILASIVIGSFIVVFAGLISEWMRMPEITHLLQLSASILVINSFGYCQLALYRKNFNYKWIALRSLVATLLSGGIGIYLAFKGFGPWSLVWQLLTSSVINLLMLWFRPIWTPGLKLTLEGLPEIVKFSLRLMLSRLSDALSTRAVELFVGAWMGAATLGIYSVGSRVYSIVMQLLSNVVLDVAHSGLSRISNNRPQLISAYYKSITLTAAVCFPLFIILSSISEEFCVVLFGNKWLESSAVLMYMSILGAFQCVQFINSAALNALGKTGATLKLSILKATVTFMGLYLYGHESLIEFVRMYVMLLILVSPVSYYYGYRVIGINIKELISRVLPFILSSGVAWLTVHFLKKYIAIESDLLRLLSLSAAGLLLYVSFVVVLTPKSKLESLIKTIWKRNDV